jgi:L-lactate utilization protein LutC
VTSRILELAEECKREIECTIAWADQFPYKHPDIVSTSENVETLKTLVHNMDNLRGCIIHLRLFNVDEHIINALEAVYNEGISYQGWMISGATKRLSLPSDKEKMRAEEEEL